MIIGRYVIIIIQILIYTIILVIGSTCDGENSSISTLLHVHLRCQDVFESGNKNPAIPIRVLT